MTRMANQWSVLLIVGFLFECDNDKVSWNLSFRQHVTGNAKGLLMVTSSQLPEAGGAPGFRALPFGGGGKSSTSSWGI